MVSMMLALLLAVAAVVALSSSAVVDPKDGGNVRENLLNDNKVKDDTPIVPDLTDGADKNNGTAGNDAKIDGIPLNSLTQVELTDLLDDEDNIVAAELGKIVGGKVVAERNNEVTSEISNGKPQKRQRRWVGLAARMFSAGRALFSGAVRAPKPTVSGSRITQSYTRPGNYNDAVRDFNRFRPDNLSSFNKNGISGQTGTVGNHRFTVRDGSKQGSPTLEIRSPRPNGEQVRKFRYEGK